MQNNTSEQVLFWWSVVTTIVSLLLLCWDIWQFSAQRKNEEIQLKEKQLHKAQVKIWQHFAHGISMNLLLLTEACKASEMKKVKAAQLSEIIKGIQATANSLYISLNEERLFTDDEIKARQLENESRYTAFLKSKPDSSRE